MYLGMAKMARDEGRDEIADWFETLAGGALARQSKFPEDAGQPQRLDKGPADGAPCAAVPLRHPDPDIFQPAASRNPRQSEGSPEAPPSTRSRKKPGFTTRRVRKINLSAFDIATVAAVAFPLQRLPHAVDPSPLATRKPGRRTQGRSSGRRRPVLPSCDVVCYMTKCPMRRRTSGTRTSRTMLRANDPVKSGRTKFRGQAADCRPSWSARSPDPGRCPAVNAANRNGPLRAVLQKLLGVDARRRLPEFDSGQFPRKCHAEHEPSRTATAGSTQTGGGVFHLPVNYNEPGIGHDLLKLLDHNAIPYVVVVGRDRLRHARLERATTVASRSATSRCTVGCRRLRHPHPGALLHAGCSSRNCMLFAGCPLPRGGGCDTGSLRYHARAQGRTAQDRLHGPLGKVCLTAPRHSWWQTCRPRATRGETLKMTGAEVNTGAARATTVPGASARTHYALPMKIGRLVFRAMGETTSGLRQPMTKHAGRHIPAGMEEAGAMTAEKPRHCAGIVAHRPWPD